MAITVGSVDVDIIPNTQGIYQRLRDALVPAATRAGEDAGKAAGRSFGPAMQAQIADLGLRIGEEIGRQIAGRITAALRGAVRDGITQGGRAALPAAARQGDETGGAFSRSLKARLEVAFRALPKLQVGADTSEADADLQALRVRMETLADKRIGIDISAADAKAEIRLIEAELTRLGAQHPNVQVRADTATALAQLAAVRAEIDAVDGKRARIDVDTSGATSAVLQLGIAFGALGALPVLPILAAGLGAVTAAAVAAAVGVGALVAAALPAFADITKALAAQKAAQDKTTTATTSGGQSASQAASRALQLAGAQQALATAHRNAGRQIAEAERAVSDAVRTAAENNAQAAGQIIAARRAVADAVRQAAERMVQAQRQVEDAERSLTQSQKAARQAQVDLTQARVDAARQLIDIQSRAADASLALRDAQLGVEEAKLNLDKVLANPKSTDLQRRQAQLAYDEAIQHLKEQQIATKRAHEDATKANRDGVDGSKQVTDAQERLAQAQQDVIDKTRALRQAQADAAKSQADGARTVADAQRKLAEAQTNASRVQQQGAEAVARAQERVVQAQQAAADAVASAQRQIQSAQITTVKTTKRAATAQDKYGAALAKLTPAARETFDAFLSLRSAFTAWSKVLQPAVMPIFTRALEGLKNALPGLTPFVLAAASAIKTLQDRASAGFRKPWWRVFKKDLASSIRPALLGLGVAFGNIFKGMVGIVDAFLPHMDSIASRMQRITGRFAAWGSGLKGSPAFERFLAYAAENGPLVAETIGKLASAFLDVSHALSPLTGPALLVIGALADGIGWVARNLPWLVQGMYAAWIVTRLWTLAVLAFNLVLYANPIVLIGLAILALVATVIYAYNHFQWFHDIVQTVWQGIQDATLFAWRNVLKPAFDGLVWAIQAVGNAGVWLWQNVLQPTWEFIKQAALVLYQVLVFAVFLPIAAAVGVVMLAAGALWKYAFKPVFTAIAAAALWLWQSVLQPAFSGIAGGARWLWRNVMVPVGSGVSDVFRSIGRAGQWLWQNALGPSFRSIGSAASGLYNNVISPVFHAIGAAIGVAWRNEIRPAFNAMKTSVGKVGDAFGLARDAIGIAWRKIQDLTKVPVNWVIRVVWNNGIVKIWDKITGWIPGVPELKPLPLLAQGGTLPVQPGIFNRPTAIVGEGNPQHPEYVIPTDPKYRARALALHQAAGAQLLAGGGILGGAWDGITDAGGWVKDRVGDIGNFLKDPAKNIAKLLDPLIEKMKPLDQTAFGALAAGIPRMAIKGLKGIVKNLASTVTGGIFGDHSVNQWRRTVEQALRITDQPLGYTGITLRRMNQESGGNPNIVNKWDSNWRAGTPSVGLMQVIGPTFRRYAGGFIDAQPQLYGVSTNPLANIYASIKYALAAYGSLPAAYNRAGGYDQGGYLPTGHSLVYNGTGRPEPVFTSQQGSALMRLATGPAAGLGDLHVQVYVGDREITDIARAEVRHSNGELIQTLRAGRRG